VSRSRPAPIGFAHRGASAHARENTLEAFALALRLGASGLESDVWISADGFAVLDHDGLFGGRPIRELPRAALPPHVPSLADLYRECGSAFELSLDVKDPDAAPEVVRVARAARAVSRLWLCHPRFQVVAPWRALSDEVRLVDSTVARRIREGVAARAAWLAAARIDALNMPQHDWSAEHVGAVQRAGLRAFAWDLQEPEALGRLLALGIDAVYSDHTDRMMAAIAAAPRG
jgi:glycerophosphoryl diester phosphodiesterase